MITKIEPCQAPMFQIAWESTLKCNLDCSYCGDGHDNSQPHPSLEDSLKTVDFIADYVGFYMKSKPESQRQANLNIQGGESIFHPHIIEILEYARNKEVDYQLYVNLITNAVTKPESWKRIAELVNYFTLSFHAESLERQQEQFRTNALHLKEVGKGFHVAVLMHPRHWQTCTAMVEWCKQNDIKHVIRQIDHDPSDTRFDYTKEQAEYIVPVKIDTSAIDLSSQGRACCGGLEMCTNESSSTKYIQGNNFQGWHCSVNKFFLYIRQSTGEVFTNKDCKMNFDGEVGPIGNLSESELILERLTQGVDDIVCKKSRCWCGLCAPKAQSREDYITIMKRYELDPATADQNPL